MNIKWMKLKNFHGFEEIEITLNDKFTVFIGENATGKTAVLDGLAIAIGGFLLGIDGVKSRNILDNRENREVRFKQIEHGKVITLERQYPVVIEAKGNINKQEIQWERSLNHEGGATTRINAQSIVKQAKMMQKRVASGDKIILPVFAYHGTSRLWARIKDTDKDGLLETGSRLLGYKNCLNPMSNEKLFMKWFKKMTLIEMQEEIKIGQLTAVKKAMQECIKGLIVKDKVIGDVKVFYNINSDELQITLEDGTRLPYGLLSDGYRNILGMVGDIAFRMATLNPFLEDEVIKETPGIVLIDEVDLHLHPEWQRKVVGDFKRVFPKVQFIATTHSPFIIQSLEEGELRNLDEVNNINKSVDYSKMSIEDITEDVMGVAMPQWSEKKTAMFEAAKKYYEALNDLEKSQDDDEIEKLKNKMDELTKPFADDIAYMAFLERKRAVTEYKKYGGIR